MGSHGNTRLISFVSRVLRAFLQRDYRVAFVQLWTALNDLLRGRRSQDSKCIVLSFR